MFVSGHPPDILGTSSGHQKIDFEGQNFATFEDQLRNQFQILAKIFVVPFIFFKVLTNFEIPLSKLLYPKASV